MGLSKPPAVMTTVADLRQQLNAALDPNDAAECHGALSGFACGSGPADNLAWAAALPDRDTAIAVEKDGLLKALGEAIATTLDSGEMQFAPLLPDDSETIEARAAALRLWCRGFLYGFGIGFAPGDSPPLPDEVREVLGDFSEIARQELDAEPGSEADETAYTEIVEYVRVGVQLVFETVHPTNQSQPVLH